MGIDTSKPHLGRIYDFMLGGHHNYEVDRQAAAQILKVAPTYPKWARANRWFLQFVAAEWEQAGRKQVLDLATGLPTKGHFNDMMPAARILSFARTRRFDMAAGEVRKAEAMVSALRPIMVCRIRGARTDSSIAGCAQANIRARRWSGISECSTAPSSSCMS